MAIDSEFLDILLKHWVSGPCWPNPTYYTSIQLRIYRATRILGFKKLKSNPRAILGHTKTKGPFLTKWTVNFKREKCMAKIHNSSILSFTIIGNRITVNLMYNTWGLLFSIGALKAPQNFNLKTKKNRATTIRNFWQNSSRYQKVQDKWPPLKFNFRRGLLS